MSHFSYLGYINNSKTKLNMARWRLNCPIIFSWNDTFLEFSKTLSLEEGARFSTQKMTWHCCCHNVTTFLSDYLSCFLHSLPDRGCLKVGQKELNILLLLPPSHSIGFGEPRLLLMWANFTLGSKQRATVLQSKNSLCNNI